MDRDEARTILLKELSELRELPYASLVERLLDTQEIIEATGPSGAKYCVELQAFWDDRPQGNLRVLGAVDDGGWRAFAPLTEDFIRAPDGSFVDE